MKKEWTRAIVRMTFAVVAVAAVVSSFVDMPHTLHRLPPPAAQPPSVSLWYRIPS